MFFVVVVFVGSFVFCLVCWVFLFVIVWFDQGLIHTLNRSEKISYKLNVYFFFAKNRQFHFRARPPPR